MPLLYYNYYSSVDKIFEYKRLYWKVDFLIEILEVVVIEYITVEYVALL